MSVQFPRTMVGGVSLPRMIIGSNWLLGYSHSTAAMGEFILRVNSNVKAVSDIACAYLHHGIDAIMIPFTKGEERCYTLLDGLKDAEDRMGMGIKKIIVVNPNVEDTKEARQEAEDLIKHSKDCGADFTFIFHGKRFIFTDNPEGYKRN